MTNDNNEMVEVTTEVDRMYRVKDTDREAITVKAGVPTKVPTWVAREWAKPKTEPTNPTTELAAANKKIEQLEAELERWQQPHGSASSPAGQQSALPTESKQAGRPRKDN